MFVEVFMEYVYLVEYFVIVMVLVESLTLAFG
jgi:hypothetical protein